MKIQFELLENIDKHDKIYMEKSQSLQIGKIVLKKKHKEGYLPYQIQNTSQNYNKNNNNKKPINSVILTQEQSNGLLKNK